MDFIYWLGLGLGLGLGLRFLGGVYWYMCVRVGNSSGGFCGEDVLSPFHISHDCRSMGAGGYSLPPYTYHGCPSMLDELFAKSSS